ncbi:DUF6161 domain-containing protein [Echinicola sp. 20G]|uniref:DUF6161 domain-containing protein n=1 Tax=Echinicola sp. 20G TaxID=2781961 RepID=UPI001910CF31|nr:DUF6161 domain-containing protein [Echinicola sp. 20G]
MTTKEFRELISESKNKDLFFEQEAKLYFPQTGIDREFKNIPAFHEYLMNQISGLKGLGDNIPDEFQRTITHFKNQSERIEYFAKNSGNRPPHQFKSNWNNVRNIIPSNENIFEFDAPITDFLLDIFVNKNLYYTGALHYMVGKISAGGIQERKYLNGLLLGYEYFQKGETEISKRRTNEKSSLTKLRKTMDSYKSDAEKEFIELSTKLKEEFDERNQEILELKEGNKTSYEEWFSKTSDSFDTFNSESKKRINDLEELYKSKLSLEAPAKYWNDRATKLKTEGYKWLAALVVITIISAGILTYSLNLLADGVLKEIFKDTASAIKWSVIFITIVSLLAFLIKTFSKMTFSTFHMARDAEEREQLTYVYLAMKEKQSIDETERHLIMQSLFSRVDTGLLKDDASPTMPGNIVDKFISGAR